MSWTDERIETLKKMWDSGLTATQIAEELGGVSRNAVIGKAHRLGLPSRPSPVKSNEAKAAAAAAPAAAAPAEPKPAPAPKPAPPPAAPRPQAAAPA
ncbi:GcrA family cell cycle regulator, partial [Sphingomonas trueperi]